MLRAEKNSPECGKTVRVDTSGLHISFSLHPTMHASPPPPLRIWASLTQAALGLFRLEAQPGSKNTDLAMNTQTFVRLPMHDLDGG